MKVFELRTDPRRYCNFALSKPEEATIYDAFDGAPLATTWRAVTMTPADVPDDQAELGDYALLGTIPVFSLRAVDVLLDMLKESGELLPLRYRRGEYFAYNVTLFLDALDAKASAVTTFSTGRVMAVHTYAFDSAKLVQRSIFKIPELPKAHVFVTDVFVERVKASKLTGFDFPLLWSSSGTS
jgi:hypothetical protein